MVKGVYNTLVASISLGLLPIASYMAASAGIPRISLIYYRFAFAFIFSLLICLLGRIPVKVNKKQLLF